MIAAAAKSKTKQPRQKRRTKATRKKLLDAASGRAWSGQPSRTGARGPAYNFRMSVMNRKVKAVRPGDTKGGGAATPGGPSDAGAMPRVLRPDSARSTLPGSSGCRRTRLRDGSAASSSRSPLSRRRSCEQLKFANANLAGRCPAASPRNHDGTVTDAQERAPAMHKEGFRVT